jgi:hypothetical protein
VSVSDGEPLIADIQAGATVRAMVGPIPSLSFKLDGESFQIGSGASDPDTSNDDDSHKVWVAPLLFEDGFESGDTALWSGTVS